MQNWALLICSPFEHPAPPAKGDPFAALNTTRKATAVRPSIVAVTATTCLDTPKDPDRYRALPLVGKHGCGSGLARFGVRGFSNGHCAQPAVVWAELLRKHLLG